MKKLTLIQIASVIFVGVLILSGIHTDTLDSRSGRIMRSDTTFASQKTSHEGIDARIGILQKNTAFIEQDEDLIVATLVQPLQAEVETSRQESRQVPTQLTEEDITRAVRVQRAARRLQSTVPEAQPDGSTPESYCNLSLLPIHILFSDYTVQTNGQILQDGGWTQAERDWMGSYFCKMLPVIQDVYGNPYKHYELTFVKHLGYSGKNVFVPLTLQVLTANGSPTQWYPQLLVHELLHAWRWQWILSGNHSLPNLFPNDLNSFEEAFAQGASYGVMNHYLEIYGNDDEHVPYRLWASSINHDVDLRNDSSMITRNYWDDSGGTQKFYERYEVGAATIAKLELNTPGFYKVFNEAYFNQVNQLIASGDPNHVFTRAEISRIIGDTSQSIEGRKVSDWINDHHIFDQITTYGKKVWFYKIPAYLSNPRKMIYFVETFPNASNWAYYIQAAKGYLYHRLNHIVGILDIVQTWDNSILSSHQIRIQPSIYKYQPPNEKCGGVDCSYDIGFNIDLFEFYQPNAPLGAYSVYFPKRIPQPVKGLYRLDAEYQNPNFVIPPKWGIEYDGIQQEATSSTYALLGLSDMEYKTKKIVGGIIGANNGEIVITHKDVPGVSETCPVEHGLFYCDGQSEWFTDYLNNGTMSMLRGILTFAFTPEGTSNSNYTERVVDVGYLPQQGIQHFLFDLGKMN